MIARSEGQVILVSGVVPGERAAVLLDRIGKGVAYGHAATIEEPSADRRPRSSIPRAAVVFTRTSPTRVSSTSSRR